MATVTSPLALPAAGGERPRGILTLTALLAGAGMLTLFGALIAAYLHLRVTTREWPPEGVHVDFYLGNMLVITMLLSAFTATWAFTAVGRGDRRQAVAANAITAGLGLAFVNLLWYTGSQAEYGAISHSYATVVTAAALLLGLAVLAGVVFALLTLARVAGAQVNAAEPDQARACAWYWIFTVVASVAVWYTVIVLK